MQALQTHQKSEDWDLEVTSDRIKRLWIFLDLQLWMPRPWPKKSYERSEEAKKNSMRISKTSINFLVSSFLNKRRMKLLKFQRNNKVYDQKPVETVSCTYVRFFKSSRIPHILSWISNILCALGFLYKPEVDLMRTLYEAKIIIPARQANKEESQLHSIIADPNGKHAP